MIPADVDAKHTRIGPLRSIVSSEITNPGSCSPDARKQFLNPFNPVATRGN